MPLYPEDLQLGRRFRSGDYQMTAERMKAFAAEFDPQPFHLDEAAGENGVIGYGGEIAWPRPTRPGDILRLESEIVE